MLYGICYVNIIISIIIIIINYHVMLYFGKLKLSCDVIVVNHLSHQVIVFE